VSEAEEMSHFGLKFDKPKVDVPALRAWKDNVVAKGTKGLAGLAKQRRVQVITGVARFSSGHMVEVQTSAGRKTVSFDCAIIAAGSQSARIPGFPYDDDRLLDSTSALQLKDIPKRLLVIGGGIIGLEMATVYDALGSKITVVELLDGLIPGVDRSARDHLSATINLAGKHVEITTQRVGRRINQKTLMLANKAREREKEEKFLLLHLQDLIILA
jgi:dihydrolipoamide dehydrogenase